MKKHIKVSFLFTLLSTVGLGIVYPTLLAVIAFFMPSVSRPSLPTSQISNGFQGRPSIGGAGSGASNLALTSQELQKQVANRFHQLSLSPDQKIPADLLFASASGCDPHLSVESLLAQVPRIAQVRSIDEAVLLTLIKTHTHPKLWGFIGTEMVDVDELNQAVNRLKP